MSEENLLDFAMISIEASKNRIKVMAEAMRNERTVKREFKVMKPDVTYVPFSLHGKVIKNTFPKNFSAPTAALVGRSN